MTTTSNIISRQIWYTNINDLNENVFISQDDKLQHILSENNYQQIKRFIFIDDRKRALLSLFLQRRLIEETFNLSYLDYEILRIKEVTINIFMFKCFIMSCYLYIHIVIP